MLLDRIFNHTEAREEIVSFYRNIFPEKITRPTLHEQYITALTIMYFIDVLDSYGEVYNSPISEIDGDIFLHEFYFLKKSMRYMDTSIIPLENEFTRKIESGENTFDDLFDEANEFFYTLREFYRGLQNSSIPYDHTLWRLLDEHLYMNDLKDLLREIAYNTRNLVTNEENLEKFITINQDYFRVNPRGLLTDERNNVQEFKECNTLTKYILLQHCKNVSNTYSFSKIYGVFKLGMEYGEGGGFTISDLIYCDNNLGCGSFYRFIEALITWPEYNSNGEIKSNINVEEYVNNFDSSRPMLWNLELARF